MKKEIIFNSELGRVYKDEFFVNDKEKWATFGNNGPKLELEKIVGRVTNVRREGDHLVGEVHLLETQSASVIYGIGIDNLDLMPCGVGTLKDNVVQDDYKLLSYELVIKK